MIVGGLGYAYLAQEDYDASYNAFKQSLNLWWDMGVYGGLCDLPCFQEIKNTPEQILNKIYKDPNKVHECAMYVYAAQGQYEESAAQGLKCGQGFITLLQLGRRDKAYAVARSGYDDKKEMRVGAMLK